MDLNNLKKVLVVGLGFRTGLASANFLAKRGVAVSVSDTKSEEALAAIIADLDPSVEVFAGKQDESLLKNGYDLIVLSPGVPQKIPLIRKANELGIPVIAEIELASFFLKGHTIAITGTDGKSTTTTLMGHIFRELGFDSLIGGNIGIPLISLVDKATSESIVSIELSSFQLETIDSFNPEISAVLNITPDHLDRYDSMEDYAAAKMRITKNQTGDQYFVFNADDLRLQVLAQLTGVKLLSFSLKDSKANSFYRDGVIYLNRKDEVMPVLETSRMKILGIHNVQNAMAALLMTAAMFKKINREPDYKAIADAIASFTGLAHRMEVLGEYQGRTVINDSKATTVGAVRMALRSLDKPVHLILGGLTKGDDYSTLIPDLEGRIASLILIGQSTAEFMEIFKKFNPSKAIDLDDALVKGISASKNGDVILLSPACASFDMFKSFEHRGDVFRDGFKKLVKGELKWI